jgi:hypothetical protein
VIEMAIPFLSCHAMSNYFQMLFEQLRIPNTCQIRVQLILFRVLLLQSCYITIQSHSWLISFYLNASGCMVKFILFLTLEPYIKKESFSYIYYLM